MKRKLSVIMCCLFMLSMIIPFQHKTVFASENKTNEFKIEEEGSTSNFVKFFIEDRNHELIYNEFHIQVKNLQGYPYMVVKIERTEDGWLINLENLNWGEGEKKYVSVTTSKYLLTKEITKTDEGSTIELKPDENLVPIQISVPFAGGNFNAYIVRVNYLIEDGGTKHSNYGGYVKVGTLIPQGTYNIQLIGEDENNLYDLVKENSQMTKDNNTVIFQRDEVTNVKINLSNLQSLNAELNRIVLRNSIDTGMIYTFNTNREDKTYNSCFVNKKLFNYITYGIKINSWLYEFDTEHLELKDDPTLINVGANLKANINLNKSTYVGRQRLEYNEFKIIDEYNNRLTHVQGLMVNNSALAWELKSENGQIITVPIEDEIYPTVPNVVGTFDISVKNTNGPVNISCDPVKITITSTSEEPVNFADPNLEKVIREAIKKPEGEIYKNDLTQITSLNCNERNITSLDGIENLTNLNSLSLAKNNIEDITPLDMLNNLSDLNLYRNKVKNIDALGNMNNLQSLVLDVNEIEDISVLKNKLNLKELSVCANPIKDLDVLKTLPNLTSFHFGENQNVDISILECLPNLTDLRWAYTSSTENIDVLKKLTKLKKLRISGNKIKDVTPLATLTNLLELYIDENQISDITPLVQNCINGGFSEEDTFINMSNNNLDITQGSKAYNDIQTLINKGVNITYEPQPIYKLEVELLTKVEAFKIGEDAKLEYKVTNNMSEEKEVTLIIGVYNKSNTLIGHVKTTKIVKVGETVNLEGTIIGLPAGACKVKAFVWNDLKQMNPYINAVEIPVN